MRNYLLLFVLIVSSFTACSQVRRDKANKKVEAASNVDTRKAPLHYIKHDLSWEEIMKFSEQRDKPIFLDIQTKWCKPCRQMEAEVFTDIAVAQYLNMNFVTISIDAEVGTGPAIAKKYGVTSYPTLVMLNRKGELLLKRAGGLNKQQLMAFGKQALSANPTGLTKDIARFEKGEMPDSELLSYLDAVLEAKMDCGPALDKYINTLSKKQILTKKTYDILRKYKATLGSDAFALFPKYYKKWCKIVGKEKIEPFLYSSYLFKSYRQNSRVADFSDVNVEMWAEMEDAGMDFTKYVKENYTLVTRYLKHPEKNEEYMTRATKLLAVYPGSFSSMSNELVKNGHQPKLVKFADDLIPLFAKKPGYEKIAARAATSYGMLWALNFHDFKKCYSWYQFANEIVPGLVSQDRLLGLEKLLGLAKADNAGEQMPSWTFKNINGKTVSLKDFKGKYIVLDWWASWCGPCIQEIPEIKKAFEGSKDKDIVFISMTVDEDEKAWRKAVTKNQIPWNNVRCTDDNVRKAYKVGAYPTLMLLDKEGKMICNGLRGNGLLNAINLHAK